MLQKRKTTIVSGGNYGYAPLPGSGIRPYSKAVYQPQCVASESIDGYRGPRQFGAQHPCVQISSVYSPVHYNDRTLYPGYYEDYFRGVLYFPQVDPDKAYDNFLSCAASLNLTQAEVTSLLQQACGDIKPAMLLGATILELPESIALHAAIKAPLMALFKEPGVRRKWKNGADLTLAEQFGLAPLVSDIKTLWNLSRTVDTKLSYLRRVPPTWESVKTLLKSSSARIALVTYGAGSSPSANWRPVDVSSTCKAWLSFKHRRRKELNDGAGIAAAAALTGFDRPLSLLWEMTPFSFVADWFLPIGDTLANLQTSALADTLEIQGLMAHVKGEIRCTVRGHYPGLHAPSDLVIGTYSGKAYQRFAGIPINACPASVPGIRQFLLGANLAFQRL